MNKLLKLIFFYLLSLSLGAQPDGYVFSVIYNVPYTTLDSTIIITSKDWDDFDAEVPLGFNFKFMGKTTNKLYFDSNEFNAGTDVTFPNNTNFVNLISLVIDLWDRSTEEPDQNSDVSYKIVENNGSKVAIIQWKNAGIYDIDFIVDSVNFQYWFYEKDNTLEFRFGDGSYELIENYYRDPEFLNAKGPVFFLGKNINFAALTGKFYYTKSEFPAVMDSIRFQDFETQIPKLGLDSFPRKNTIFRWKLPIVINNGDQQLTESIAINASVISNSLQIKIAESKEYTLRIFNSIGRQINQMNLNPGMTEINWMNYQTGQYYLLFENEKEKISYKVLKI